MTTVKAFSELLELLQRRWDSEVKDLPDTYRPPVFKPDAAKLIEAAACLHAAAHHSDPFAYGRVKLHIKRGLVDFTTTRNDALSRLAALAGSTVGVRFPAVTK
jgi:hypothetical protein